MRPKNARNARCRCALGRPAGITWNVEFAVFIRGRTLNAAPMYSGLTASSEDRKGLNASTASKTARIAMTGTSPEYAGTASGNTCTLSASNARKRANSTTNRASASFGSPCSKSAALLTATRSFVSGAYYAPIPSTSTESRRKEECLNAIHATLKMSISAENTLILINTFIIDIGA